MLRGIGIDSSGWGPVYTRCGCIRRALHVALHVARRVRHVACIT